jgi:hypothetical protein
MELETLCVVTLLEEGKSDPVQATKLAIKTTVGSLIRPFIINSKIIFNSIERYLTGLHNCRLTSTNRASTIRMVEIKYTDQAPSASFLTKFVTNYAFMQIII